MYNIFISDIFGKTPALEELVCTIERESDKGQSKIIDPYSGKFMNFTDESEAYSYFMDTIGMNQYCKIVKAKLKSMLTPTRLIGFSVGASALWNMSENLNSKFITRAVCFYGSQIRNYMNINPNLNIELVLPSFESGFNITEFAKNISKKPTAIIHKTDFLHGFMNSCSKNFNQDGYKYYIDWLIK